MNTKELQKKQLELDSYICKKNNIDPKKIFFKKIIALDVELSEFMNEIESFKYWKTNKKDNREKIIEEACDCLHFILSLSNDLNVDLTVASVVNNCTDINNIYRLIKNDLWKALYLDREVNSIKRMYVMLIDILNILEFNYSDLLKEYNKKYEINIKRQNEGY